MAPALLSRLGVSTTNSPRLDGFDAAYLLRIIAAATRRGLPIGTAVSAAGDLKALRQIRNLMPRLEAAGESGVLDEVAAALERGRDGPAAAMLRAAQATGMEPETVHRVAAWCVERQIERDRMLRTVSYPVVVAVTATLVFTVIFHGFIGPMVTGQLGALFEEIGAVLPMPTRVMLAFYSLPVAALAAPTSTLLWLALVVASGALLVSFAFRLPDRAVAMFIPGLPRTVRYQAAHAFCSTLAVLLRGGMPLPEALAIAASAVPNVRLRQALEGLGRAVSSGKSLGEELRGARALPASVTWRLWSAYFRSELLPELERVAVTCHHELRARQGRTHALMNALAWAFAVVVGAPIGALVIAMYMPLFSLISKIG